MDPFDSLGGHYGLQTASEVRSDLRFEISTYPLGPFSSGDCAAVAAALRPAGPRRRRQQRRQQSLRAAAAAAPAAGHEPGQGEREDEFNYSNNSTNFEFNYTFRVQLSRISRT